jgi:hypothetical protein
VHRTMFCIAFVVVAEPLAASILLPFVVFMVRSFNQVDERSVGLWCGIISMCSDPWFDPDADTLL